jgi:hypothetical protein
MNRINGETYITNNEGGKVFKHGLMVSFEKDEATPIMVYVMKLHGGGSATYWAALDLGEVEDVALTPTQHEWLETLLDRAEDWERKILSEAGLLDEYGERI